MTLIRGTTDTKAGWSQILTGYDPDVSKVFSNSKYQPVPEGLSVFERLKQHFGADAFVTVAVIGKKEHCGDIDPPRHEALTEQQAAALKARKQTPKQKDASDNQAAQPPPEKKAAKAPKMPAGGRIVEENGTNYLVVPGKPYVNMATSCDQWVRGLMQDEAVGQKAMAFFEQYKDKPFFFFVHFASVDHRGHASGENSEEYSDALVSNDTWTGKLIAKLKELGLYDQTIVYVTADHGFDENQTSHHKAPLVFLATNDRGVCRNGDRADITPTIYDRFGLDLSAFQPPLAGRSLLRPAAGQPESAAPADSNR